MEVLPTRSGRPAAVVPGVSSGGPAMGTAVRSRSVVLYAMTSGRGARRRWVRTPFLIGFLATLLVFGIYLWSRWPRPSPSPEVVARKAMEAFERSDYDGLLKHINYEEKRLLRLEEDSLAELVNRFYKPNTSGFKPRGQIVLPRSSESNALAMREYVNPDGRKFDLMILVASGEDGPKVYGFVYMLVGSVLKAKLPPGVANGQGLDSRHALLRAFEEELPVLDSLRVPGDTISDNGRQVFRSWKEIHKSLLRRAADRASRE